MPSRTRPIRLLAALALAVPALVLGACGDDDDEGDSGSPTKAEYIEQGDAICQELYTQRGALEAEAAKAAQDGDPDRAADVFENAAEITDNRMTELEDLPVPEGDEEAIEEVVDRGKETAETARDAAEAIRRQDQSALAEISADGRETTVKFNKAAIDYGFFVCGRGPQATIG